MKKSIAVSKGDLVFAIVLLLITFIGIEYIFYIKDINTPGTFAISFFPLLIVIRFSRILIAEMKKK